MAKSTRKLRANDVELGLNNIPQWLSGVKIPAALTKPFGINPNLIGKLNLESLAQTRALSEGALLQVEMANKFFEYLKTICDSHEEIEDLRAKAVRLMYDTRTREDSSIMSALLAGTKYEEHLLTWNHKLTENQNLIKGEGKQERDYLSQDFKNKLLIAAEQSKRKRAKSDDQVKKIKDQSVKVIKEDSEENQALIEARARLDKILKG